MRRYALAVLVGMAAAPALGEPYRALPRHPSDEVRDRASRSRAAQRLHAESPAVAALPSRREASSPRGAEVPAEPERPRALDAHVASPGPTARPSELKVSVGQARSDGGVVMLVEDPSGARIELVLDGGGRLLSVQRAGAP